MFVFSVKMTRKRVVAALVGTAVVASVALAVCLQPAAGTVGAALPRVNTTEDRVALLSQCGYEAVALSETVQEIVVPEEPDTALTAYEELLTAAGMSLLKYGGKRVKLYTYDVAPAENGGKRTAHLYVYRNRVIAGDITDADPNGRQLPLTA